MKEHLVEVAGSDLVFKPVPMDDDTPTGAQIGVAAGFRTPDGLTVLQILSNGDMEDVRPHESASLAQGRRFLVVPSDRSYRLTANGQRFDWPCRFISGMTVKRLANSPLDDAVIQVRPGRADRLIANDEVVDLDGAEIETFVTRRQQWRLDVQGIVIVVDQPQISVRDALDKAKFDISREWQIFLKLKGLPKERVVMDTVIDLERPGIERLRVSPKEVNNGEQSQTPVREFALLPADEAFLNQSGLVWETVIEQQRRWLLIHDYAILPGYSASSTLLALEIPSNYPSAQIYGFYAYPPLRLAGNGEIASTQMRATVRGLEFHGWSRTRGNMAWDAARDNVVTQLALVDAALAKEVEA